MTTNSMSPIADTDVDADTLASMIRRFRYKPDITADEIRVVTDAFEEWGWENDFYQPSDKLKEKIQEYLLKLEKEKKDEEDSKAARRKYRAPKNDGKLLEEIAYLAFQSLRGIEFIRSYTSFNFQLDLEVVGSGGAWTWIMDTYLGLLGDTFIVEAKDYRSPIEDKYFSRLTHILDQHFTQAAHIGIFFAREGASGFPEEGTTLRSLRGCQATQMMFWARTNKFIIVFNKTDIGELGKVGALLKMIKAKIRDVQGWTGMRPDFDKGWDPVDLPSHLSQYRLSK